MDNLQFGNVTVVLAEPNPDLRHAFNMALRGMGFKRITETGALKGVRTALLKDEIDLIVADTALPDGNLCDLIQKIRHREIGGVPFAVVLTLVSNPIHVHVKKVINSGTDDLLLKPVTPEKICSRIRLLSQDRKKFVVTTGYIGPDRRRKARSDGMEIPLITVPNPLQMNRSTFQNFDGRKRVVESAFAQINLQKVERHAYQIGWLSDRIEEARKQGKPAGESPMPKYIERLYQISRDMSRRSKNTVHSHLIPLCLTMTDLTKPLKQTGASPGENDNDMIKKIAAVIRRVSEPEQPDQTKQA